MAEIIYKTISMTVSATTTSEETWSPEAKYTIKNLMVNERSGTSLNNVHLQILIAGTPIMRDSIPLANVGDTINKALPIERTVPSGTEVRFKVTNNLSSAVTIDLVLVLEKAG